MMIASPLDSFEMNKRLRLIMVGIPFATLGSFLALFLACSPAGVTVLIGVVVIMGCAAYCTFQRKELSKGNSCRSHRPF